MKRIEQAVFWPKLAPEAEKKGLKVIAVWENGFRQITNNKRPIKVPADLAGIKLRVPGGKWRVKMFQAYGANPSPMKFSELFTALQTGVMDGEENPLTQIYTSKFQEVQKYLSMTDHSPRLGERCNRARGRTPVSASITLGCSARRVRSGEGIATGAPHPALSPGGRGF